MGRKHILLLHVYLLLMSLTTDEISTEEKIKKAAMEAFTRKGYHATTTRDIAAAADINIASLHYYFRSKDNLFQLVARGSLIQFNNLMIEVFAAQVPLKDKIYNFVERFTDFYVENPYLPGFIVAETERNSEVFNEVVKFSDNNSILREQLLELETAGQIRSTSLANFISNLVGLTIFPFLCKNILSQEMNLDNDGFEAMLDSRKKMIPRMIINDLYI
ncbi:MAG: TetR/AcrR family transcriptional regulator [Bacteroidota bacterium]